MMEIFTGQVLVFSLLKMLRNLLSCMAVKGIGWMILRSLGLCVIIREMGGRDNE